MYIQIFGWHTFCFRAWGFLTVIRWRRWRSGLRWRQSWWRYTTAFASPPSRWILCCVVCAKKTAIRFIFPNHSWVSFYRSLPHVIPGKHNTPLPFVSDFGTRRLNELLRFLNRGAREPFISHFPIFKARRMSDCWSCTRPPCLAILADMLKTYKKLVAASWGRFGCYLNHIRLRSLL